MARRELQYSQKSTIILQVILGSTPKMWGPSMGKVLVKATIQNLGDLYAAQQGNLKPDKVRKLEIDKALVDTGATFLSLPKNTIKQLGLKKFRTRKARTAAGEMVTGIYEAVRLTIDGRDCTVDVAEVKGNTPLIGQIPLEALDFVVDPVGRRLLGNPEHGGEHMIDIF